MPATGVKMSARQKERMKIAINVFITLINYPPKIVFRRAVERRQAGNNALRKTFWKLCAGRAAQLLPDRAGNIRGQEPIIKVEINYHASSAKVSNLVFITIISYSYKYDRAQMVVFVYSL